MSNSLDQTSNSNSNHLLFHCSSGELLWGQLHCICEGHYNRCLPNRYDTPQSVPEPSTRGTIIQRSYQYRCRAVKGDWQAKLYRTRLASEPEPFNSGYVIYNIHYNPIEILRRCAAVGYSLHQNHDDRRIIYINRYDWSWHHDYEFRSKINGLLGIRKNNLDDDYSMEKLFAGRIIICDSASAMNIIQPMKSNPTEFYQCQEKVFIENHNDSNHPIGLHLSFPKTDYDLAWLVFNSDQPDSELIGIVYDGCYTDLHGQIMLEQQDVVSWNEYELKRQEQDRVQAERLKEFQSKMKNRTIFNQS